MNIGESLVVKGGDAWKSWDKSIAENLNRVQNNDGSWTRPPLHHRPDLLHLRRPAGADGRSLAAADHREDEEAVIDGKEPIAPFDGPRHTAPVNGNPQERERERR